MEFNSVNDIEKYLGQIPKFQDIGGRAAHMGLDHISAACKEMGNPQDELRLIHVAGTNGKGTVCHSLSTVYQQAGYRVGLYISPHLLDFRERIRVNGAMISNDGLVLFFKKYYPVLERYHLTYFEIFTLMAFWWFRQQNVDIAVIETGLGGRLDATNIINPIITSITSVSLDHKEYLGSTIPEIATEKAGIIKKNIPVVIGKLPVPAKKVIIERAKVLNSEVIAADDLKPAMEKEEVAFHLNGKVTYFTTDLYGPVQAVNLAVCWQIITKLQDRFPVSWKQFGLAVKQIRVQSKLMARFEPLQSGQDWYFDGAHNIEAIRNLKKTIKQFRKGDDPILVISLMKDKINSKLIKEFSEFKKIFYYELNSERAAGYEEVSSYLEKLQLLSNDENSIRYFIRQCNSKLVIFTGSFYFYKTVKDWINKFNLM